jgi:hypothetical protein
MERPDVAKHERLLDEWSERFEGLAEAAKILQRALPKLLEDLLGTMPDTIAIGEAELGLVLSVMVKMLQEDSHGVHW